MAKTILVVEDESDIRESIINDGNKSVSNPNLMENEMAKRSILPPPSMSPFPSCNP
jgi:hypothetical protein